jgi:D-tagatose-1,6-bisphosphate aldolase subunit GatZ/KbaZ
MDVRAYFDSLIQSHKRGAPWGVCSVCSANPYVIRAAMEEAFAHDEPALIEATANQVNQDGGYTGMKPADFRDFVYSIADSCSFPQDRVILGGDHLGPHPWRNLPAERAMRMARQLVESYALAGFEKIHLDTSMHLGGDDPCIPLGDEVIARRGAQLCATAEQASMKNGQTQHGRIVYVIGSEVPSPGGPMTPEAVAHPTSPEAFLSSYSTYGSVFADLHLEDAFARIVAFVVQPGVEFIGNRVFDYDPTNAMSLCAALKTLERPIVFEGHSTDYQTQRALSQLVRDGVGILKVGPALTFALREGILAMEAMEGELLDGPPNPKKSGFSCALERAMLRDNQHWHAYYKGDERTKYLQRRYSYYDRSRYYLNDDDVKASIDALLQNLAHTGIPEEMLSQYLPFSYRQLRDGQVNGTPQMILLGHIRHTLREYHGAAKSCVLK